jgi:hypothetical protein
MAKFSMKQGGKEVGSAAVYAAPHTMDGKAMTSVKDSIGYKTDPNSMSAVESTPGGMPARRVSMGNPDSKQVNKNGEMKQRGSGAATKGFTSRGPMA